MRFEYIHTLYWQQLQDTVTITVVCCQHALWKSEASENKHAIALLSKLKDPWILSTVTLEEGV